MKFDFRSWWSGSVIATVDIADETPEDRRTRVALEVAVRAGVSLTYASLDRASLVGARLDGASLDRASLNGASLDGASLVGARLDGASLDGASLVGARLVGASLVGANLDDASLVGASLRSIRTDLFDVLLRAQPEVPALLAALRAGRIDGSTYSGECACLVGTIAKARHCDVEAFDFRDARRPIERWFTGIRPGDTPDKHAIARITEGWILEFMALTGIKDEPVAP